MAGTITALKVQERSKDRISVYLDGQFTFGLALIHALWLRVGQHLSDDEIKALHEANTLEKAKQRALGLISYRPRSVQEVRRRLRRAGVDDQAIEEVVASLMQSGLLDDASFSRSWVESRQETSPRSKRMMAWELRQKGISAATITASLQSVSDEEAAYQLAQKRWPRVADIQPPSERRRRLIGYLARHGFNYDTIRDALVRLSDESGVQLLDDDDVASVDN